MVTGEMITELKFEQWVTVNLVKKEEKVFKGRGDGRGEETIMRICKIMSYRKETVLDGTESLERNVVVSIWG